MNSIFNAFDVGIRQIDVMWYAFGVHGSQVFSIGSDAPKSGRYIARMCDEGIKEIASPQNTRKAAYQKCHRYLAALDSDCHGEYLGEV